MQYHTRSFRWTEFTTRFHWNPILTVPSDPNSGPIGFEEVFQSSGPFQTQVVWDLLYDDPPFAKSCMQDMVRTSCRFDYNWMSQQGTLFTTNPSINRRFYNIGIPGEVEAMTDATVTARLQNDSTGKPWTPFELPGKSAAQLYDRLAESPLSPYIHQLTDPLDTDWSIWFLVKDIKDAPKLLKNLRKSVMKLKSIIRSNGVLGAAADVRSAKEFAKLRLAQQYGLQPTIDSMREFCSNVLKWYATWVKKTHTFGTLRTARRRQALKLPHTDATIPLRFPAGGTHWQGQARTRSVHAVLNTTVKYYFVCPELTNKMNVLKSIVDQLGIFDPAALWDNIPFSFVVDWFWNVSKFLHKMKPTALKSTLVIADWCESIVTEHSVAVSIQYTGSTQLTLPEQVLNERLFACVVRQHVRRRQFPYELKIGSVNMGGSGLTPNRTINGACIIIGNHVHERPTRRDSNYRGRGRR